MEDIFGLLTSGTQAGYEDSSFFWSDTFHYRKTYHFARTLYKNALNADAMKTDANEPSRVPKQQAFALGWISHCATDVAAPPVHERQGAAARTGRIGSAITSSRTTWTRWSIATSAAPIRWRPTPRSTRRRSISGCRSSPSATRPTRGCRRRAAFDWFPSRPPFPSYPQGEDVA